MANLIINNNNNSERLLRGRLEPGSSKYGLWTCRTVISRECAKSTVAGVPFVAQRLTTPTSIHEDPHSISDLAQWVKDPALL